MQFRSGVEMVPFWHDLSVFLIISEMVLFKELGSVCRIIIK